MLTRREFTEMVSCALCVLTAEPMPTEAAAQGTPATTPGVTRKILSQIDGPAPGYVTILAEATIDAGVSVGRRGKPLEGKARLSPRTTAERGGKFYGLMRGGA